MTNPYSPTQWLQLSMQQQGLLQPFGSLPSLLQQLSYVQIDSINVVERAHHHVLHSRLPHYATSMLDEAMGDKTVFEYWSHAAAYLPMEDYRFSLYRKRQLQQGDKHWFEPEHKVMREVKARITAEGPLKASQFKHNADAKAGTWWDWKPAKKALEQLFMQGELMVAKRDKFQKVYDLTDRVLPNHIDTTAPSDSEFARHLIKRYLVAHGFGNFQQIQYLRKGLKPLLTQALAQLCEQGDIARFTEPHTRQVYFYLPNLTLPSTIPNKVWLLNPFDNLVIQRQKLKQWFGFDYQIEVYVPEPKRQYGYYSLPILWRDRFVGRVDVKADRKNQCLLLQQLHFEPGAFSAEESKNEVLSKESLSRDAFVPAFIEAINHYSQFNDCQRWQLVTCNDKAIGKMLHRACK